MSLRYRLKRNSDPVYESIPAHPDAIYRPQHRPRPASSDAIALRSMVDSPVVAAPLAAGGDGFSPWWIIGPLLALLAAMALGALLYIAKKKHTSQKQSEEENDQKKRGTDGKKTNKNKEENPKESDSARKFSVENERSRSTKSDTISIEQKRTVPMSSTAKGKSPSNTNPLLFNKINNEQVGKSTLPAHDLPLANDISPLSPIRPDSTSSLILHSPVNVIGMTKPNSHASQQSDEKNTSKTVPNTLIDSQVGSPLKNSRFVSADHTKPNYSGNLPPITTINPISLTASTMQNLGHPNDGSDFKTDKVKSDANPNKKGEQSNEFKKTHDDRSPFKGNLTNLGHLAHTGPLKAGQNIKEFIFPSSHSEINDRSDRNKRGDGHRNQPNSPEQHGVGKSPLISNIPTGSKRSEREKAQSRTNQTKEGKSSSKSSSSNPDLQRSVTTTEPTNEKKSTSSSPAGKSSRHIQSFAKGLDSNPPGNRSHSPIDLSNPPKSNNPHDDKSDESNTSLTQPNLTNHNKINSLMPNVPQCKTNTSSDDDDDYDEIYPIPANNSPPQQLTSKGQKPPRPNSNLNINASIYRKNRTFQMHKLLTKRVNPKDKI